MTNVVYLSGVPAETIEDAAPEAVAETEELKPVSLLFALFFGHVLPLIYMGGSILLLIWTTVARTSGRIGEEAWLAGLALALVVAFAEMLRRPWWKEMRENGLVPASVDRPAFWER